MTKVARSECSLASPIAGGLCAVKWQQNYGASYRSLPPLPEYKVTGKTRTKWGCDKNESRYLHNISRASEVPAAKLEGYMYGKSMWQDLSVLPDVNANKCLSAHKDSKFEVFPEHNPDRKAETDGKYVLGDSTRRALHNYFNNLYRTSTYSSSYQDNSKFMFETAQRDAQFHQGCVPEPAPPCTIKDHHPYTCRKCKTGGCNKNIEEKHVRFQSQSYDYNKINKRSCQCEICVKGVGLVDGVCPVCDGCSNYMDDVMDIKHMDAHGETKLPSSMQCPNILSESITSLPQTNTVVSYQQISSGNSESLCLPKLNVSAQDNLKSADTLGMVPKEQQAKRNSWTNRDNNNLRVPCMSNVLGLAYEYKAAAQKRFHLEHPEKVPDLRKFNKKVTLLGFSTSLFR